MHLRHADFEFELNDRWWLEARMTGFVPSTKAYRVDAHAHLDVFYVNISDVAPVRRQLSHGVFNDDPEKDLSAEDRVLRILGGFRTDSPIPPVQVRRQPKGSVYAYQLWHGAHRFYCSLAAGFSEIPAIEAPDF